MPRARELPDEAPFWTDRVTLGMVVDGEFHATHTVGEKNELIDLAPRATVIVATWHGTYRSDLFTVSVERLKRERAAKK